MPNKMGDSRLSGYLKLVTPKSNRITGLSQSVKKRWFVLDESSCKLHMFDSQNNMEQLKVIDLSWASLTPHDKEPGIFSIHTGERSYELDAGSQVRRMFWLQQLQKVRRDHCKHRMDLLSSSSDSFSSLKKDFGSMTSLAKISPDSDSNKLKRQPAGRPRSFTATQPNSDDSISFRKAYRGLPMVGMLGRDGSDDSETPPPSEPARFHLDLSPPLGLKKFLQSSFRLPKHSRPPSLPSPNAETCPQCEKMRKQIANIQLDMEALKDGANASEQVIEILRQQVDNLTREKETLIQLLRSDLTEAHIVAILREKDEQLLENDCRMKDLESQVSQIHKMRSQLELYEEILKVKDEAIVSLTNDLHDQQSTSSLHFRQAPEVPVIEKPLFEEGTQTEYDLLEVHRLKEILRAFKMQNTFLNVEVVELSRLLREAALREDVLQLYALLYSPPSRIPVSGFCESGQLSPILTLQSSSVRDGFLLAQASESKLASFIRHCREWEGRFYQTQSKYLSLLSDLHVPAGARNSICKPELISRLLQDVLECQDQLALSRSTMHSGLYDQLGFTRTTMDVAVTRDDPLLMKALSARDRAGELAIDATMETLDPEWRVRWEGFLISMESEGKLMGPSSYPLPNVKLLLRSGIPLEKRRIVWSHLIRARLPGIQEKLESKYYHQLLGTFTGHTRMDPVAKQIELDLVRTLPNNRHYESLDSDGIPRLRRVLLAFSLHHPDIGYCQGLNRVAAIALLFLSEEEAFWCLVHIVEHLLPPEYYSRTLLGAQVDQRVLKELVGEKMPALHHHLERHCVDLSLFTFNWFLCIFVDNIPVRTYLRIWDTFLYEGSKVLFRYALAILRLVEPELLRQTDHMSMFNLLHSYPETLLDASRISQVAFLELNPFPMRHLRALREKHLLAVRAQIEEIEAVRHTFKTEPITVSKALPDPDEDGSDEETFS
ncbi:unnamed protein product [Darwinula stevensoni]|uniref:TBC1 domain family member 2B n=1 Tax=Darwinula stevensoni TaxID=69355 RepID=A0A7R8X0S1_9CRUS|nr:unnamed protein product [Darwinula stevensoni]CAG0879469.1 unnamed protein product [Darwinula stevensoni]